MQPFFSIVVPIYNVERYLEECLNSILAQTFGDFEVVLVNDGSTDGCPKICEKYLQQDHRIILINQSNQGLLMARRNGLKKTTGKYVVHIDSDDSCKPNLLERLYTIINERMPDLIIYGFDLIDEKSKVVKTGMPVFNQDDIIDFTNNKEELIKASFETHMLNNIWIKCAKRECIDVDEDYMKYGRLMMGEDILQSTSLYENASRIVYVAENLYLYRVNNFGMSRAMKKEYLLHFLLVRQRVYEMIQKLDLSTELRNEFYRYYIHYFANYATKLTLICNRDDFCRLIDESKKYLIAFPENEKKNLPIKDRLSFRLCYNKCYFVIKIIAEVVFGYKRINDE